MNIKTSMPLRALTAGSAMALAALLAAQPAVAENHAEDAAEMTEGEERLAELLEGRVAGEPVNCIRSRLNDRMRVIDETAYVYGRGRTIYVQRTRHPERIDDQDTLVTRRFSSSQICRLDQTTTVDRHSGFFTGAVFFEEFVPYTRVENAEEG